MCSFASRPLEHDGSSSPVHSAPGVPCTLDISLISAGKSGAVMPPDLLPSRDTLPERADSPLDLLRDLQRLTAKHARAIADPENATAEEMKKFDVDFRARFGVPDHPSNAWKRPMWRRDGDFETALYCGATRSTILLQFRGEDGKVSLTRYSVFAPDAEKKKAADGRKRILELEKDSPSFKEMLTIFNKHDTSAAARTERLSDDTSLKHLRRCFATVRYLEKTKQIPETGTEKEVIELAAWISRNLSAMKKEPSAESVLHAVREIRALQKSFGGDSLFAGRNIVILSHGEVLADSAEKRDTSKRKITPGDIERYRKESGDDHRFGKRALLSSIASFAGGSEHCFVFRPAQTHESGMRSVFMMHADTFRSWFKDGDGSPSDESIARLKTDLKVLLGVPPKDSIVVNFTLNKDKTIARLKVDHKDSMVFSARVELDEEKVKDVTIIVAPKRVSHEETKKSALRALEKTPPGKSGLTFVFDGHGSGKELFLSRGERSGEGFDGEDDAVCVTASEFAKSMIQRQSRFGTKLTDVIILECCHSTDFARCAGAEIRRRGGTPPIFICSNEMYQNGYSTLTNEYGGIFFDRLMNSGSNAGKRTISDVIQLFESSPLFNTNPTIFVPGPKGELRQISRLETHPGRFRPAPEIRPA